MTEVNVSSVVAANHLFLQVPSHPSFCMLEKQNAFMIMCYGSDGIVPQLPRPIEGENTLWLQYSHRGYIYIYIYIYMYNQTQLISYCNIITFVGNEKLIGSGPPNIVYFCCITPIALLHIYEHKLLLEPDHL